MEKELAECLAANRIYRIYEGGITMLRKLFDDKRTMLMVGLVGVLGLGLVLTSSAQQPEPKHRPFLAEKTFSGIINGEEIEGHGVTFADPNKGIGRTTIIFSKLPKNFNPLAVAISLQSDHCTLISFELLGAVNLLTLTGANYDVSRVMKYPDGSVLRYTSKVRRVAPTLVSVEQRWSGTYTGPTDIVNVLPYDTIMRPTGPGGLKMFASPVLVRADGSKVQISWEEEYSFNPQFGTLPFEQVRTFTPILIEY
ncbi:MAG: hypothetical protein NZ992_07920, partial [Candidatus Korarchaeum sp.]|nr:hypothetical protein [Candidatus Korarchaeum sp.]